MHIAKEIKSHDPGRTAGDSRSPGVEGGDMKDGMIMIALIIFIIGVVSIKNYQLILQQEKEIATLTHNLSIKEGKIKELEAQVEQMKLDLKIKWKGVK